jgi:hypothetical protein
MLSDRERATWDQIRDQFLIEDPGFVQRFNPPSDLPLNTRRGTITAVQRILLWCAGVLGVLLLLAGAVGGALMIAMLGVAMLIERR